MDVWLADEETLVGMLTAQEVRRDIGGARLVGELEQYCLPQLRFEFRG